MIMTYVLMLAPSPEVEASAARQLLGLGLCVGAVVLLGWLLNRRR